MTALELVTRYGDAWQNKRGDLSEVPLAENFRVIGPVASFETAEVLEVADGKIVRGELLYDAEGLPRAMAQAQS